MKICLTCNINKKLSSFSKWRKICHSCRHAKRVKKEWFEVIPAKVCTECNIEKTSDQFHRCKRDSSGLVSKCKECRVIKSKDRYNSKKEIIKKRTNKYYHENKEEIRPARRRYTAIKRSTDPFYSMKRRLRNRLYCALRETSWKKNTKFTEYIGCTLAELKNHIENQFTDGMSWVILMTGAIHLDHIIPLSSAKTQEELYKLCHYTNIQPLWAIDNIRKSNKMVS